MKRLALSGLILLIPALLRADEKETMLQALGLYEQAWRSTPPCELNSNACQTREIFLLQQAAQAADRYLGETAAPPAASGIAVLPFESLNPDKENAFFADGIYDGVSTRLAKLTDLRVISHNSVGKYRGSRDTREIGRALNVAYVVEGSVRVEVGRIHLNAQLIDTRTEAHVWAQEYDRDLNDVYALQREIAQKLTEQLGVSWRSVAQSVIRFSQVRSQAYAQYIQLRNDPAAQETYHSFVDPLGAEFVSTLKGALRSDENSREIAERFGLVDF